MNVMWHTEFVIDTATTTFSCDKASTNANNNARSSSRASVLRRGPPSPHVRHPRGRRARRSRRGRRSVEPHAAGRSPPRPRAAWPLGTRREPAGTHAQGGGRTADGSSQGCGAAGERLVAVWCLMCEAGGGELWLLSCQRRVPKPFRTVAELEQEPQSVDEGHDEATRRHRHGDDLVGGREAERPRQPPSRPAQRPDQETRGTSNRSKKQRSYHRSRLQQQC